MQYLYLAQTQAFTHRYKAFAGYSNSNPSAPPSLAHVFSLPPSISQKDTPPHLPTSRLVSVSTLLQTGLQTGPRKMLMHCRSR